MPTVCLHQGPEAPNTDPEVLNFVLKKADKRLNPDKQHRKLQKLQLRAQDCLSREEAQKIIKKAEKAHRKLTGGEANG